MLQVAMRAVSSVFYFLCWWTWINYEEKITQSQLVVDEIESKNSAAGLENYKGYNGSEAINGQIKQ
jgi:hypothetical protein